MEFLILLVLSVGFCQASSLQHEADHDDPEVVDAVARAIKVLNDGRRLGNKFAVSAIHQAYRIAGAGIQVTYQVRSNMCDIPADAPLTFRDTLEFLESHSGNCTAEIDIHDLQKLATISQKCEINPRQEKVDSQCIGCWQPVDLDSPEVLPIVRYTIRQFNNHSKYHVLFDLGRIIKIYSQVVNGRNYLLEYSVKKTNCFKATNSDLSPACRRLPEDKEGFCIAYAFVDNANSLVSADQVCRFQVEEEHGFFTHKCSSCPMPIASVSSELDKPLEAIQKYLNCSENVVVSSTTKQIVFGILYRIDLQMEKNNCSMPIFQHLNEDSTSVKDDKLLFCQGLVWVKPWKSLIVPQVTCTNQEPKQVYSCMDDIYIINGNSLVTAEQECRFQVEKKSDPPADDCISCFMVIPPDSPELKEPLKAILKYLNYSKDVVVIEAAKQVVDEIIYRINFRTQETCGPKAKENERALAEETMCQTVVRLESGKSFIVELASCRSPLIAAFLYRPPGFTPFTRK